MPVGAEPLNWALWIAGLSAWGKSPPPVDGVGFRTPAVHTFPIVSTEPYTPLVDRWSRCPGLTAMRSHSHLQTYPQSLTVIHRLIHLIDEGAPVLDAGYVLIKSTLTPG
jgi:hypothetical protein